MANIDAPSGAHPIKSLIGDEIKVNKYVTAASDDTPIYVGDFVSTNNTFDDEGNPVCYKTAVGTDIRGIVVEIVPLRENNDEDIIYRKANEVRALKVCDDPYIQFSIQGSGTLTTTPVGLNADIILGTPSNATGISGTEVDLSTLTTGTAQLKILSVEQVERNELGTNSKLICMIFQHELYHSTNSAHVYMHAYSTNGRSITNDSAEIAHFQAFTQYGGWTTSNNKFTAPVDGVYKIDVELLLTCLVQTPLTGFADITVGVVINSSSKDEFRRRVRPVVTNAGGDAVLQVVTKGIVRINEGDEVYVDVVTRDPHNYILGNPSISPSGNGNHIDIVLIRRL